jgi:hypothetical protein
MRALAAPASPVENSTNVRSLNGRPAPCRQCGRPVTEPWDDPALCAACDLDRFFADREARWEAPGRRER